MIHSAGIDIVSIQRMAENVNDDAFLKRLLTDREREYIFSKKHPDRHLAGRFAAKEAVMKAMGTGWDKGVGWRDIEITHVSSGQPTIRLQGQAREIIRGKKIFLSLAYAGDIAVASAVIESSKFPQKSITIFWGTPLSLAGFIRTFLKKHRGGTKYTEG